MTEDAGDIVVLSERITHDRLRSLLMIFEEMVKYVVDIEQGVVAIGGELHADAEQCLLEMGSQQKDLWGANYYPGRGREHCIEFTSLINVRPAGGNPGMEIQDAGILDRVRALTFALIGEGEAL